MVREDEIDWSERDDTEIEEEVFVPPSNPQRPSMVSPNGNVAGSSQVERDPALRDFIYGSGQ
jgi:hypothetical protein